MPEIRIDLKKHETTGLLMAFSDELPGFIVHAHSEDELRGKLAQAFSEFMAATGTPVWKCSCL